MDPITEATASSHLVNRMTSHLVTWCEPPSPLPHQRLMMLLENVTSLPIPLQELSPQ